MVGWSRTGAGAEGQRAKQVCPACRHGSTERDVGPRRRRADEIGVPRHRAEEAVKRDHRGNSFPAALDSPRQILPVDALLATMSSSWAMGPVLRPSFYI